MRQLASIQRITDIQPIEGADAIDVASVLGWKVVVKKGEFQVGDLAVYVEIDSVVPDEPEYRFLWKFAEQRPNNFRVKTIKLRGQVSQGILFPMSIVTCKTCENMDQSDSCLDAQYGHDCLLVKFVGQEGDDLTEALGITKYEAPLPRGADDIDGQFFDGVPKTDEDRVQSRHDLLAALQGRPYYISVKCDGASMTVAMHDSRVKVASRNYRLTDTPDSAYWRAARGSNGLIDMIVDQPWLAVQGELVGPGIQNNRLGLSEHYFVVFDIFDRHIEYGPPGDCHEGNRYLSLDEIRALQDDWGFHTVGIVETGDSFAYTQDELLALAEGKYPNTTNEREGIVIRNNDAGDRVSFKAISNRYLLKGGE